MNCRFWPVIAAVLLAGCDGGEPPAAAPTSRAAEAPAEPSAPVAGPERRILELGGNDLLRGLSPEEARDNLAAILDELKKREVPVVLYGMRAPPNAGPEYQAAFDGMYPELARQYGAALVPFFMEPVAFDPSLRLPDRIHPTAEGVDKMVAATVEIVAGALPED